MRVHLTSALDRAYRTEALVGSDQFVYWNARDPKRCLSPDVYARVGDTNRDYRSWKTWERGGPPHLAIEIVSDSDASELRWEEKFERYHELGIPELVRFDADDEPGRRLRVWDRIEDDLVERVVEGDTTECVTLGATWEVGRLREWPIALRARRDGVLLLDGDEAAQAYEQRIRELEAKLAAK